MKSIGSTLFILGVLAIILNYANRVPTLLAWIYMWGEGPAWAIKISCVALGAVLWIVGKVREPKPSIGAAIE